MIGVFESKSTKHSFLEEMHFSETFARRGECKLSSKLRSVVVVAAGRRQLGKPASPAKKNVGTLKRIAITKLGKTRKT